MAVAVAGGAVLEAGGFGWAAQKSSVRWSRGVSARPGVCELTETGWATRKKERILLEGHHQRWNLGVSMVA